MAIWPSVSLDCPTTHCILHSIHRRYHLAWCVHEVAWLPIEEFSGGDDNVARPRKWIDRNDRAFIHVNLSKPFIYGASSRWCVALKLPNCSSASAPLSRLPGRVGRLAGVTSGSAQCSGWAGCAFNVYACIAKSYPTLWY
jgi:hypothetical protein